MNHFPIHNSSIHEWAEGIMIPYFEETTHLYPPLLPIFSSLPRYLTNASYYFAPRSLLPASMSRAGGFPAVGLLVDLLPVGLLVGEVAAGLAAIQGGWGGWPTGNGKNLSI